MTYTIKQFYFSNIILELNIYFKDIVFWGLDFKFATYEKKFVQEMVNLIANQKQNPLL